MNQIQPLRQSKRILIVDDSPDLLLLYKTLLQSHQFDVLTAESGEDGLQKFADAGRPDLILVDMMLGDMSGAEFIRRLRRLRPNLLDSLPIVYLTGMSDVDTHDVAGVIHKPVEIDGFIDRIEEFLGTAGNTAHRRIS